MKGRITRIDQLKQSVNGNAYTRVTFVLEDKTGAKTDLCPNYRNYTRWKPLLQIGKLLDNLTMKDKLTVDADSFPTEAREQKTLLNDTLGKNS